MQASVDTPDKLTSSPTESAQVCWSSDSAHQNALKQQGDTKNQSDTKPSHLLEGDDSSFKQSKLRAEGQSDIKQVDSLMIDDSLSKRNKLGDDTKPSGSLESDDSLLKESNLEAEAQSDTTLSGSPESDDASLKQGKQGAEGQSDTKQSDSLGNDFTLNQSKLSADEPTAKKKQHRILDSVNKLVRKFTPSKLKRNDSRNQSEQHSDLEDSSVRSKPLQNAPNIGVLDGKDVGSKGNFSLVLGMRHNWG